MRSERGRSPPDGTPRRPAVYAWRVLSATLRRPPLWVGLLVAAAAVAAVTALIFPLKEIAPAVSLGVIYLLAVLLVASIWGLRLGIVTGFASALAFNFFHIPPTGRFTIADGENWVALAVFLVAALVAGSLAELARARTLEVEAQRRESELAAELARVLLGPEGLRAALGPAAQRIARAFGLSSAAIVLGDSDEDPRRRALRCRGADGELLGVLLVPHDLRADAVGRLERGVVPTLEALLRAALAREALLVEVVESRALRRSEEIKTTLLRTVSHDLRTPLTAIAASAEAVGSPSLAPEERHEIAEGIAKEARYLARLVDDLLDLSRLEAGRADPRRAWVAVDEILDAAVDDLDRSRIELRLEPGLPMLHADALQLERAFNNLLENALRHSDGQRVTVRGRVVGARLVVRVTDRGPGIPAAEHERIFEPFYRAPEAKPRSAGSGLGLAIVRGFVEANGGRVHVESYPGQGASFVVELPLVEGAR
jgi:two-component system, OmpR family, sensor histidine kinase KdpD